MDLSSSLASVKFPQLAPRYQGMPRRYEETKPVVIQDFTHRKIIGIGHEIQARVLDRLEREKTEAMEAAERATWEKAQKKQNSAVRQVRAEAAKKIDQALEQQRKEHEQKIKEEVVHVELAMQKQAIEQVQEERARGEMVLAQTVEQVQERCAQELLDAVAVARQEEMNLAAQNLRIVNEKHKAQVEDLQKTHVVELAQSLAKLTFQKDTEREQAVKEAHEYEQKITRDVIATLTAKMEAEVKKETDKIHVKVIEINVLSKQLEEVEMEKERLAKFLETTRFWFQDFINRVQRVQKGQADFMLPPAYIEEIEKGLMSALPSPCNSFPNLAELKDTQQVE